MKILYGVCGEGMGHASRSTVVAKHLLARGHSLEFTCSSGRAFDHLHRKFGKVVHRTVGLSSVMSGNRLQPLATFGLNLLTQTIASPFAHIGVALAVRRPDVVISDFEPWSARYAGALKIPLLALDNIHFMNRFDHPRPMVAGDRASAALMFAATAEMVPSADRYMVTSFVGAVPRLPRTTIHLPILREEILAGLGSGSSSDYSIVYLNDKADPSRVLNVLKGIPNERFIAYCGSAQDAGGNVLVRPFSEAGFLADFRNAKAVIGGAGFTLMTEAIYSGKPMLALPFEGQFEQILNANYLQGCGFGERAREISKGVVGSFLGRLESYRGNLRGIRHDGNRELLSSVDAWLSRWQS